MNKLNNTQDVNSDRRFRKGSKNRSIIIALLLVLYGLLITALFGLILSLILGVDGQPISELSDIEFIIFGISVAGYGVAAASYHFTTDFTLSNAPSYLSKKDFNYTFVWTIACVLISQIVLAMIVISGLDFDSPIVIDAENFLVIIGMILLFFFVVAPSEEYLFRGIIQERLQYGFTITSSIIISSILFTIVHIPNYSGDILAIVIVILFVHFPLSLILGYSYEQSNNLVVPTLIHGFYNSIVFIISII